MNLQHRRNRSDISLGTEGLDRPQLLLVDDDRSTREALPESLHLRLPQIRIDVCDSGAKALDCLRSTDYFAVITDLNLTGMNGLALLGEIARVRPHSSVLVMTGDIDQKSATEALRAGAYDFIRKPIDREQLTLSILRALEAHTLRVYFERNQTLITKLYGYLRQIDQVWKPFLLTGLEHASSDDTERIEDSRTLIMRALSICDAQTKLIGDRLEFSERHFRWTKNVGSPRD